MTLRPSIRGKADASLPGTSVRASLPRPRKFRARRFLLADRAAAMRAIIGGFGAGGAGSIVWGALAGSKVQIGYGIGVALTAGLVLVLLALERVR